MGPRELWMDKCEAARGIKENFGTENALKYLIGEKFLDFLDVAERFMVTLHCSVDGLNPSLAEE